MNIPYKLELVKEDCASCGQPLYSKFTRFERKCRYYESYGNWCIRCLSKISKKIKKNKEIVLRIPDKYYAPPDFFKADPPLVDNKETSKI